MITTVYVRWGISSPRLTPSLLQDKIDWPAACGRVDHTVNANRYHKRELANIKLWAEYSTKNEAWLDIIQTANIGPLMSRPNRWCICDMKNAFNASLYDLGELTFTVYARKCAHGFVLNCFVGATLSIVINAGVHITQSKGIGKIGSAIVPNHNKTQQTVSRVYTRYMTDWLPNTKSIHLCLYSSICAMDRTGRYLASLYRSFLHRNWLDMVCHVIFASSLLLGDISWD